MKKAVISLTAVFVGAVVGTILGTAVCVYQINRTPVSAEPYMYTPATLEVKPINGNDHHTTVWELQPTDNVQVTQRNRLQ